ncbi:MAG TPA: xanthine dehydrogenase family protein molybdopterin-binding subunit [Stellaceae bacterium]|nr:xanthine dehydrogenase family protein molybdopterin-binding subunit [Stellaceae bacterium]
MASLIGERVLRVEDERLLTGQGRFTADLALPGAAHAVFLRSPHAHARIERIATEAARAVPGVLAILTGADYVAEGYRGINHTPNGVDHLDVTKPAFQPASLPNPDLPLQMPLAAGRVRHVGEGVAMVVAETEDAARAAAEHIEVRYARLPAVTDPLAALAPGAPLLWEGTRGNLFVEAENGDRAAVDAAIAAAHRVVRLAAKNQRLCPMPMEPRAAVAQYDAQTGRYTLHSASQGVHRHKMGIVGALGVAPEKVRVVTGDVGGGFGVRSLCYPEYPLLCWAARKVGRPVTWTASRAESFLSDFHAREMHAEGALALGPDGRITALALDYVGNLGAVPAYFAVLSNLLRMPGGPYDIPAIHVRVRGVSTNTQPTGVYRGAGRPESCFIAERLLDLAAAELGLDRAELRRRNVIRRLPYPSPLGHRYDTGAFAENLDKALGVVDWQGFPARRAAALARGKLAGIAVVNYLESPTGFPIERTDMRVLPEGRITAVVGTGPSGQGHETSFAQVVASELQLPMARVAVLHGDSDVAIVGGGSHSDRSMRLAGTILVRASGELIEKGRARASQSLEAAAADISYENGRFAVVGTDRAITLFELAAQEPLEATAQIATRLHAHPTGACACEVEIDPETGSLRIVRYVTVDDVGRVINPMIVEGQVHGGIAQGVGQAVMEACVYDGAAQLVTGSFLDYAMPRADDFPPFATLSAPTAAESNPLGVKGAGECGTTPAPAVLVNAICDALNAPHIEMPATAERIWRALNQ